MQLKERNIKLDDLLLDVDNPRSVGEVEDDQDTIQNFIMEKPDAKVLLKSMIQQVRWVNRIVVCKLENSEKYVVVEGNTRTACLKTGKVPHFDGLTTIPVLEAIKEINETDQHYLEQLKITQGIANVMTVKDWPAVSKARHLFEMFEAKRENQPSRKLSELIREIADSMGIKAADVRKSIKQYIYFRQISILSQSLDKQDFSYLEAFDQNDTTRAFFGYDSDSYCFSWEASNNITEEMQKKQNRIKAIPQLIHVTKKQIKGLGFRKLFPKAIHVEDDSVYFKLIRGELTWEDVERGNIYINSDQKSDKHSSSHGQQEPQKPSESEPFNQPTPVAQNDNEASRTQTGNDTPFPDLENGSKDNTDIQGHGERGTTKLDESQAEGNNQAYIEFLNWKNKKYAAEHIDTESEVPFYLSVEHKKIYFYTKHQFYRLISKRTQLYKVLVLLAIQEADGKTRNKEEFKNSISKELFEIWGGA